MKKTSEYTWELPKKGNMLVPAKIFSSDALIKDVEENAFKQLSNMATLKGIQKNALAMPDAHSGYGFPIGGVAAFDMDEGIISPGGVGYDINCLHRDTRIITEFGCYRQINDFDKDFIELEASSNSVQLKKKLFLNRLLSLNRDNLDLEPKEIEFFMKKKVDSIYELETFSGLKVKATGDHPFLTKKGMIPLKDLNEDSEVAVNTFEGIKYERKINKKKAILARLFGYLLGDGCIYKSKNRGYISAYGQKEDLELMKKDIDELGYNSRIISRKRDHKIKTIYDTIEFTSETFELYIRSKKLVEIFENLGFPLRKKTNQEFLIPSWIMKGEPYIKRLFLASFFGAEMSSPSTHSKTGFYSPIISQNKNTLYKDNLRKFFLQLTLLLEEFNVKVNKVSEVREGPNKDGPVTRLRLIISAEENNLLNLWRKIGFEYNQKRAKLANIANLYILRKKKNNEKRKDIVKKIKEYRKKGFKLKEIKEIFRGKMNRHTIERHFYKDCGQRISLNFIPFEAFKMYKLKELEEFGCIFDELDSINKEKYDDFVYDFTIKDNHNFIANNFIVSNCSVRLLSTNLKIDDFLKQREKIIDVLFKNVPSGVGIGGKQKFSKDVIMEVLAKGTQWAVKEGYGVKDDYLKTEEEGSMDASPNYVSDRAIKRGIPQLGSLGAGNHFLEIQQVDEIFDEKITKKFGMNKENITIMVHCGSRGLGHQVASDYIKEMEKVYGFNHLPDRELINAPIKSKLGEQYYGAMSAAANFAFANKQMITHWVRESFNKIFGDVKITTVYDICHNIAKFEKHKIDGETKEVCIHRKGAARSFGPNRKEVPDIYKDIGQPVIIPGSMGTASYVLVGTNKAEELSFGSTAHGAGRVMSRSQALRQFRGETVKDDLIKKKNIYVKSGSWKSIAEESPDVYKDINEVVRVSHEVGIGSLVVKVKPLGVIKG